MCWCSTACSSALYTLAQAHFGTEALQSAIDVVVLRNHRVPSALALTVSVSALAVSTGPCCCQQCPVHVGALQRCSRSLKAPKADAAVDILRNPVSKCIQFSGTLVGLWNWIKQMICF